MTDTTRPIVGVAAHVCHNGQVLTLERIAPLGKNTWTVLGGHLEHGEHWYDCAMREAMEEAGVTTHSPQLFAVTSDVLPQAGSETHNRHYITFHVALKTDSPAFTNCEPEKQAHLGWRHWHDLPEPRYRCIQSVYDQNLQPPYLAE